MYIIQEYQLWSLELCTDRTFWHPGHPAFAFSLILTIANDCWFKSLFMIDDFNIYVHTYRNTIQHVRWVMTWVNELKVAHYQTECFKKNWQIVQTLAFNLFQSSGNLLKICYIYRIKTNRWCYFFSIFKHVV